jgi:hypothetical protein
LWKLYIQKVEDNESDAKQGRYLLQKFSHSREIQLNLVPFKSRSVATWVGDTFISFFALLQSSNHVTFTTFITPHEARRLTSFFSLPSQEKAWSAATATSSTKY